MLSYCLKCRKKPKVKILKTVLLSKFTVWNSKKSKFIKERAARRLLSNLLGEKVPILSDIPIKV